MKSFERFYPKIVFVSKRRTFYFRVSLDEQRFWKTKHIYGAQRDASIEMRPSWSAGNWNFFNCSALFCYLHLRIDFSRVIHHRHTAFFERNLWCAVEDTHVYEHLKWNPNILSVFLRASENFWKGKHTTRVKYLYTHQLCKCASHCSSLYFLCKEKWRFFKYILQVRASHFPVESPGAEAIAPKVGDFPRLWILWYAHLLTKKERQKTIWAPLHLLENHKEEAKCTRDCRPQPTHPKITGRKRRNCFCLRACSAALGNNSCTFWW